VYSDEAKGNSFFKLCRPVPYSKLIKTLRQYDAAMHIFGSKVNPNIGSMTFKKLRYCSANKVFDFIEAGLPSLIHNGFLQQGILRHYGYAVPIEDISQAREHLMEWFSRRKKRLIQPTTLAAQSKRLSQIYKELMKSKK